DGKCSYGAQQKCTRNCQSSDITTSAKGNRDSEDQHQKWPDKTPARHPLDVRAARHAHFVDASECAIVAELQLNALSWQQRAPRWIHYLVPRLDARRNQG